MSDNQARLRELSLLMPAIQYIQKWSNAKTAEYVTAIESAFKAQATVEKCREAGFIDEKGEVRKVLGRLFVTKDRAIALFGSKLTCPSGHTSNFGHFGSRLYCCEGDCWSDGCQGDSGGGRYWDVSDCYSNREAAERAKGVE